MPLRFNSWEETVEQAREVPARSLPHFDSWQQARVIRPPCPRNFCGENFDNGICGQVISYCIEQARLLVYSCLEHVDLAQFRATNYFHHRCIGPLQELVFEPEPDPDQRRIFVIVLN